METSHRKGCGMELNLVIHTEKSLSKKKTSNVLQEQNNGKKETNPATVVPVDLFLTASALT